MYLLLGLYERSTFGLEVSLSCLVGNVCRYWITLPKQRSADFILVATLVSWSWLPTESNGEGLIIRVPIDLWCLSHVGKGRQHNDTMCLPSPS